MKQIILSLILISTINFSITGQDQYQYELGIDHISQYSWDLFSKIWVEQYNQEYIYEQGNLVEILVSDKISNRNFKRNLFQYDINGNVQENLYQVWENNAWVNSRRDLINYFPNGNKSETIIQHWVDDNWKNYRRLTNYDFDSKNILLKYTRQFWLVDHWRDTYIYQLAYDSRFNLIEMISTSLLDGSNEWKYKYTYDIFGNLIEMRIFSGSEQQWINHLRRIYTYDQCGNLIERVQQSWVNNEWTNILKLQFYYSMKYDPQNPLKKVAVCHNGHTIWVSVNAVKAHLAHGDCLGTCLDEREQNRHRERVSYFSANRKSLTFEKSSLKFVEADIQIYPNPGHEQFTLNLGFNEQNFHTVEILDLSGRVLRKVVVTEDLKLIIERGNLKKGLYFIRLFGDEVVTEKILFE